MLKGLLHDSKTHSGASSNRNKKFMMIAIPTKLVPACAECLGNEVGDQDIGQTVQVLK